MSNLRRILPLLLCLSLLCACVQMPNAPKMCIRDSRSPAALHKFYITFTLPWWCALCAYIIIESGIVKLSLIHI